MCKKVNQRNSSLLLLWQKGHIWEKNLIFSRDSNSHVLGHICLRIYY